MRASVRAESWPIRGGFRIARGARRAAEVVVLELDDEGVVGRSECVPYPRYGESVESVCAALGAAWPRLACPEPKAIVDAMSPGAARNALDCALWDLEAKRRHTPVWELLGLATPPSPVMTMRTVSVGSPARMQAAARQLGAASWIKVKVDGGEDLERLAAVHEAAPDAKLVVDANESWSLSQLSRWLPELPRHGVVVLEQPLPSHADEALGDIESPVSLCADESFHDRRDFAHVEGRYDVVNIKLDKTGGLTEAVRCIDEAKRRGLAVMIGCMVCTSLSIEPALLLTASADYVDLDGPLLLESDRPGAHHDAASGMLLPSSSPWGSP